VHQPGRVLRAVALTAVSVGVLVLAAAAFVLSYSGIHAIARQAGISATLARGYPVIFDALLVIACAAVLSLRGAGAVSKFYAWLSLLVLLAATAGADALHSTGTAVPHRTAALVAAIIPWILLLIGFGLLLAMLRHFRLHRAAAPAAAPEPLERRRPAGPPALPAGSSQAARPPQLPPPQAPASPPAAASSQATASFPAHATSPVAAAPQATASTPVTATPPATAPPETGLKETASPPPARVQEPPLRPAPPTAPTPGAAPNAAADPPAAAAPSAATPVAAADPQAATAPPATTGSPAAAADDRPRVTVPPQVSREAQEPVSTPRAPSAGSRADSHSTPADPGPAASADGESLNGSGTGRDNGTGDAGAAEVREEIFAAPPAEKDPADEDASGPPVPQPAFHRMWSSPTPPGDEEEG
jgi:hypothetical protein